MRKTRVALIVAALALMAVPGVGLRGRSDPAGVWRPDDGRPGEPGRRTTATGQGTAVISADGSTITYIVTYSGLSGAVNAAHIHTGAAGVQRWRHPAAHPRTEPDGRDADRGQLHGVQDRSPRSPKPSPRSAPAPPTSTSTPRPTRAARSAARSCPPAMPTSPTSTGGQQNPPVATAATGKGIAVISADASTVTYLITHSGLSGSGQRRPHPRGRGRLERRRDPALRARPEPDDRVADGEPTSRASGSGHHLRPGGRSDPRRQHLLQPPHHGQSGW